MERLTSKQISEWQAFDTLDPIGSWRDEYRTARIESLIFNIVTHLFAKPGVTPEMTNPIDFMPDWAGDSKKKQKKEQTVEEMKQALMIWATGHNKSLEKQKKGSISNTKSRKKKTS